MSKPHEPTDKIRAEIEALASYGVPHDEIGRYVNLDKKTIYKYYRDELDVAHIKANEAVAKFLYNSASGGSLKDGARHSDCIKAAMFWAKTRMKWRETGDTDNDDNTGETVNVSFEVKDPVRSINVTKGAKKA